MCTSKKKRKKKNPSGKSKNDFENNILPPTLSLLMPIFLPPFSSHILSLCKSFFLSMKERYSKSFDSSKPCYHVSSCPPFWRPFKHPNRNSKWMSGRGDQCPLNWQGDTKQHTLEYVRWYRYLGLDNRVADFVSFYDGSPEDGKTKRQGQETVTLPHITLEVVSQLTASLGVLMYLFSSKNWSRRFLWLHLR